ncbi:hypothetical protein HanLR1_Chr04g0122841 [Helianthus annuus]|nr:hypothetical protein HanLR1_Chr04g0122841 [Helianthus annuus]
MFVSLGLCNLSVCKHVYESSYGYESDLLGLYVYESDKVRLIFVESGSTICNRLLYELLCVC